MRLYEYQSKSLFAQFSIPIPQGKIAVTPQEVADITRELNHSVVLKPQLLSKQSAKNTVIQFAQTPEIAYEYSLNIMGAQIDDQIIDRILVETAATVITDLYIAIVNDPQHNKSVIIVAEKSRSKIPTIEIGIDSFIYEPIHPFIGFLEYQARDLASSINLPFEHWKVFTKITQDLLRCHAANDALVTEIDPLVITDKNEFLALGGSIIIDDNALYRQPALAEIWQTQLDSEAKKQAHQAGMVYKKFNGQIACAVNGSGLAMTVVDMISLHGNKSIQPATLIDMGEEAQTTKLETALHIILKDSNSKSALINIFGGITGCDTLALSIIQIVKDTQTQMPIIMRLTGERAHEGRGIINDAHLPNVCHTITLTEAVQKAIMAVSK